MIFLWLVVRDQIMVPLEGLGPLLMAIAYMVEFPVIPLMAVLLIATVVLH